MEDNQLQELLNQITAFLEDEDLKADEAFKAQIRSTFFSLHASDQAEVVSYFKSEKRDTLVDLVINDIDAEILLHFEKAILHDFAEHIGNEVFGKMLSILNVNLSVIVLSDFSKDFKKEILEFIHFRKRIIIKKLLSYPAESVGRNMNMDFLSIPDNFTVRETLDYIQKNIKTNDRDAKNLELFVLSENRNVIGSISIFELIKLRQHEYVKDNLKKVNHVASTFDKINEIVEEFIEYHLQVVPVVDSNNELVGILEINNIANLIKEQAEKSLLAYAGVFESAKEGLFARARVRFPWLFINLMTASFAASLISFFEPLVASFATLAVLTPIVASIGGNTGNQTATVIIRSLAINDFDAKLAFKEILASLINSIGFLSIAFLATYLIYRNIMLSTSFALSIFINLNMGSIVGALVPILINKLKVDPALCSSIFLTMITDMIGFFSFLGIAYFLL